MKTKGLKDKRLKSIVKDANEYSIAYDSVWWTIADSVENTVWWDVWNSVMNFGLSFIENSITESVNNRVTEQFYNKQKTSNNNNLIYIN
jgi:hypothetical protein